MKKTFKITTFQIIFIGFFGLILLGSLLLCLPVSSAEHCFTPFLDCAFTATSAVCVTGLIVRDTATYWSAFGRTLIIILIQIGGLGVVTVALALSIFSGRKITLGQRSLMQESVSADRVGGIVRLTSFILKFTFGVELIGAFLMAPAFCRDFGFLKGSLYALFHSVSAFCNAGFDLMGVREPFSSFTSYETDILINVVLMGLILIGGIGFRTWEDIGKYRFRIREYRLQSKMILTAALILFLLPAIYYFFFEFSDMAIGERLLASCFQSVTTRTAGFNTVNEDALTESGKLVTILLMLIGGAPGSTAGGMKTTTVFVLVASAMDVFRRQDHADLFGRRIEAEIIRRAAAILIMYLILFLGTGMIISRIEEIPLLTCLFETASAIGTVGITLGITPQLGTFSRLLLMALMFFGRVGGLTIIFAAFSGKRKQLNYPREDVSVG